MLMKQIFTLLAAVLLTATTYAQVGIGTTTPDASSALDITSTTKGLLIPRMTNVQRDGISPAATGLMIFCTNCASGEGEIQVYYASGWKNIVGGETKDPPAPVIGDYRDGGIVFYIASPPVDLDGDGDLDTGLVCALSDSAPSIWGCEFNDFPGVPSVGWNDGNPAGAGAEIGDGESNTTGILAQCPTAPAALAARSYGDEWFLPSAKALNEIYINKASLEAVSAFNAFLITPYWSSTNLDRTNAWLQYFSDGFQDYFGKSWTMNVRAVRAF
jgi:hypothetical protein